MRHAVHIASIRSALSQDLRSALRSSSYFEPAKDIAEAEVVIIDAVDDQDSSDLAAQVPSTALSVLLSTALEAQHVGAARADENALIDTLQGDWLILRCAPFGQELLTSLRYLYNETIFTSWGPAGAAWIDLHDVVAVMEVAVSDTTRRNVAYDLTGPHVTNMQQVCDLIEQSLSSPVFYVELDEEQHTQAMARAGLTEAYARRRIRYMHQTTLDGQRAQVTDTVRRALGRPPRQLKDYLPEQLPGIVTQARRQWG